FVLWYRRSAPPTVEMTGTPSTNSSLMRSKARRKWASDQDSLHE
ncbi:hypothetical protein A2U01_0091759, partial [Trifolium medium]|nr:hypothetical protein [Trifolium medium]